jgi:hypothetical protein
MTNRFLRRAPVIVRLQGGVGNQLFQYAVGKAVSLKLNRQLLVDPRTILPEAPARQYSLDRFCVSCQVASGRQAWCTRWLGSVRLGRAFRSVYWPARRYRYVRDRELGYQPEVFDDHDGPVVLHGYWQSHKYFSDIEPVLRQDLRFLDGPDERNREILQQIRDCEAVCVHVRRGDYVSIPLFAQTIGSCDVQYYRRAVERLSQAVVRPHFFVFSDDPEWARCELTFPGPTHVVDHNLGKSDTEDLRLMAACRHFIIANSSFSWWGAWLADSPNKTVVAPVQWFVHDKSPPEDRIPAQWIRA